MSEKIDSLMNVLAHQRATSAADRLMIEVLLWAHPNLSSVRQAWALLVDGHHPDTPGQPSLPNFDRAVALEEPEAFAFWTARLNVIQPER